MWCKFLKLCMFVGKVFIVCKVVPCVSQSLVRMVGLMEAISLCRLTLPLCPPKSVSSQGVKPPLTALDRLERVEDA